MKIQWQLNIDSFSLALMVRLANSSSGNFSVRVWDAERSVPPTSCRDTCWDLFSFILYPDGRILATSSQDRTTKLWDVQTGSVSNAGRLPFNFRWELVMIDAPIDVSNFVFPSFWYWYETLLNLESDCALCCKTLRKTEDVYCKESDCTATPKISAMNLTCSVTAFLHFFYCRVGRKALLPS